MQCVCVCVCVCVCACAYACVCVCVCVCFGGGVRADGEEKKTQSFHIILEICKREI